MDHVIKIHNANNESAWQEVTIIIPNPLFSLTIPHIFIKWWQSKKIYLITKYVVLIKYQISLTWMLVMIYALVATPFS